MVSSGVLVVGGFAILSHQHQQRLQAEARAQVAQDQANQVVMERLQGDLTLRNALQPSSQREATLQLQLGEMDAGPSRLVAAAGQQQARLGKQVDCAPIQLTVNQLSAQGDTDQALRLQTPWATPCPNLQATREPGHQIWWQAR